MVPYCIATTASHWTFAPLVPGNQEQLKLNGKGWALALDMMELFSQAFQYFEYFKQPSEAPRGSE